MIEGNCWEILVHVGDDLFDIVLVMTCVVIKANNIKFTINFNILIS